MEPKTRVVLGARDRTLVHLAHVAFVLLRRGGDVEAVEARHLERVFVVGAVVPDLVVGCRERAEGTGGEGGGLVGDGDGADFGIAVIPDVGGCVLAVDEGAGARGGVEG